MYGSSDGYGVGNNTLGHSEGFVDGLGWVVGKEVGSKDGDSVG